MPGPPTALTPATGGPPLPSRSRPVLAPFTLDTVPMDSQDVPKCSPQELRERPHRNSAMLERSASDFQEALHRNAALRERSPQELQGAPHRDAAPVESQGLRERSPEELRKAPHRIAGCLPDLPLQRNHSSLYGAPSSPENRTFQDEGSSEHSALLPHEDTVDDLIRNIDIIKPGNRESTYRAKMLIDSGNPHRNIISSKVVDALCIPRSHRKPSIPRRMLHKLAPWTKGAKAARQQTLGLVRSIDGTLIRGQDGSVTISWYGENRSGPCDPILYFQPRRYETTHVVVDADKCSADVILTWKEVQRLRLRDRFVGPIRPPPTPEPDPDDKAFRDYEERKSKNKSIREDKRGKIQSDAPNAGSANQPDK